MTYIVKFGFEADPVKYYLTGADWGYSLTTLQKTAARFTSKKSVNKYVAKHRKATKKDGFTDTYSIVRLVKKGSK